MTCGNPSPSLKGVELLSRPKVPELYFPAASPDKDLVEVGVRVLEADRGAELGAQRHYGLGEGE